MSGGVWLWSTRSGHYYPDGADVSACGRFRHRGKRVTEPQSADAERCADCVAHVEAGA